MSLPVQNLVSAYVGTGSATQFPYTCHIWEETDLVVTVNGTRVYNYTVSGVGEGAGGTVTFATAPAVGAAVVLRRVIPLTRDTTYATAGDFRAVTVNSDQDRQTALIQQVDLALTEETAALRAELYGIGAAVSVVDLGLVANLEAAIEAFGSAQGTITIATPQTLTGSRVIPATLNLRIVKPAVITIPTGMTLTINSPFDCGAYQIFSCEGTGAVTLNGCRNAYPEWWGGVGDGTTDATASIQATLDSGAPQVLLGSGIYLISDSLLLPDRMTLAGQNVLTQNGYNSLDTTEAGLAGVIASQRTVIKLAANRANNTVMLKPKTPNTFHGTTVENLCLYGNKYNQTATGLHGVHITDSSGAHISGAVFRNLLLLGCGADGFRNDNTQREMILNQVDALANGANGFTIQSDDIFLDLCWAGFNENDGVVITGNGNHRLNRIDSYYNQRHGIYAYDCNTVRGSQIQSNSNGQNGIYLNGIWDVRLLDLHIFGNGQAAHNTYADFYIGADAHSINILAAKFGQHYSYTNKCNYGLLNQSAKPTTINVVSSLFHLLCYGVAELYDVTAESTVLTACQFMTSAGITTAINQRHYAYTSDHYTARTNDEFILINTATKNITVTLPALADLRLGHQVVIQKHNAANLLTIAPSGGDAINGITTLTALYSSITMIHAGSTWLASLGHIAPRQGTVAATTLTPDFIGQEYLKTDTGVFYKAKGLTGSDWVALN